MGTQSIQGNQNVQVQDVDQSLVQIIYNRTPHTVPLEPAYVPVTARSPSPARLVRAHAGVFPYIDRGGFLAELEGWVDVEAPFAGVVVGGQGGSGKTRLAVELCEKLRKRAWLCGFLSRIADQTMLDALVQVPTARLVVVDYAESRAEQLQVLLPLLKSKATIEQPVRVLLLVRAAPSQAKNWASHLRNQIDALDAVLDECEVRILDDVPLEHEDRMKVFEAAAGAFAGRMGRDPSLVTASKLEEEVFSNPLMLVIAAYLAAHGNDSPPSSQSELLDEVLAHERRYWRQSSAGLGVDDVLLERLVALATLTSADSENDAASRLRLLPDLVDAPAERRTRLARWVQEQYPGPRWWNPLEPDLVGEHLVAHCFSSQLEVLQNVLQSSDPDDLTRPLEVLARASADHQQLASNLQLVIEGSLERLCGIAVRYAVSVRDRGLLYGNAVTVTGALALVLEAVEAKDDALTAALGAMPPPGNILLNGLGAIMSRQQVSQLRGKATSSVSDRAELAGALNDHANWCHAVGRSDEALQAIQEAVSLYRDLAAKNSEYKAFLALALNNLGSCRAEAEKLEEALEALEEAVVIHRNGDALNSHEDGLASTLNNIGNCLWLLNRHEEALVAINEAVDAYRPLAATNPGMYAIRLAKAINNMSNCLGNLGRFEEALEAIEESVMIRRPLAASMPATFDPELALALKNRGYCLVDLGRDEEAVESLEEAAQIYRPLVSAQPERHTFELALTLRGLWECLERCGREEEAANILLEMGRLIGDPDGSVELESF